MPLFLFLLMAQSNASEEQLFALVRREVSFVPAPVNPSTALYRRDLELSFHEEDSSHVVEGVLVERILGPGQDALLSNFHLKEKKADTTLLKSYIRFEFSKGRKPQLLSIDMQPAYRPLVSSCQDSLGAAYPVVKVLKRFGLKDKGFLVAEVGSQKQASGTGLLRVEFKDGSGYLEFNVYTGAVAEARIRPGAR